LICVEFYNVFRVSKWSRDDLRLTKFEISFSRWGVMRFAILNPNLSKKIFSTLFRYVTHFCLFTMVMPVARLVLRLLASSLLLLFITTTTIISPPVHGFISPRHTTVHNQLSTDHIIEMSSSSKEQGDDVGAARHPFCDLPGDPSLILTTNVDLGSKKLEIMKGERERKKEERERSFPINQQVFFGMVDSLFSSPRLLF
jgi:hypothetical protein